MSENYIGELRMFAGNFAPKGWAQCNGQLLAIAQNQALFAILGTTYGGNGTNTFALPDLRGAVPVHVGNNFSLGQRGGEAAHTLTVNEMSAHTHAVSASANPASSPLVANNVWSVTPQPQYAATATGTMSAAALTANGGSQPHENQSPSLVVNICIALTGIFPTRS